jgi:hypothetical protein
MSVGRQLCARAIETAAELRRYADTLGDFKDSADAK